MAGKACGGGHIAASKTCRAGQGGSSPSKRTGGGGNRLKGLERNGDGQVKYRGRWWKPNQPTKSSRPGKKRMVLATKKVEGETRVKVVHYGATGYSHNYSPTAKKSYLARASAIRNKSGGLASKDPFSPNHWAIKDLWDKKRPADGSTRYQTDAYDRAYRAALALPHLST